MQTLIESKARLAAASRQLIARKARRDTLQAERDNRASHLTKLQQQAAVLDKVVLLLQETGKHAREQSKASLETMVTFALRTVFGADYSFKIELLEYAGRPTAEFYVTSHLGGEPLTTKPQDSRGGGVVDVVSLGLRVAMLETYQPRIGGPLVLDEPAKHVSDDFIQAVADFLKRLSERYRRQVIMVTHNDHISDTADSAHRVILRDGTSLVTRER